jgi:beta-lactamase regulating signal transducer with metallopeptidase domain
MSLHDSLLDAAVVLFKSPFRSLWPLIAIPAAAALVCDRTAARVPRTPAGSGPAAALAAAPGLVGLAVICNAISLGKVVTWRGVVFHWLTPAMAAALAAYAIVRTAQRLILVARLFASARPAGPRLASAAAELGLRALEIPSQTPICLVAGVLRPTVFVSSGALAQLDAAELSAALHHERAHLRGRDTQWLVLLAFLRDLAPFGRGAGLDAFRATREAAADRAAAGSAGRLTLASALVALARPGRQAASAAVLSMAQADTFRWRMQALLGDERTAGPSWRDRAGLAAALALCAALLAWPLIQFQFTEMLCGVR